MTRKSMSRKTRRGRKTAARQPARNKPRADLEAAFTAAAAHYGAGRLEQAEEACEKILHAAPEHSGAMCLLGAIATRRGKNEVAVKLLSAALAINPADAEAHNTLGMARANQGNLEEAVTSYRRAVELDPAYSEAHNNLGNVLRHQEKLEEAAACYQRVIDISPNSAAAHNNLGMARKGQGKLDEAIAGYRRAIEINPEFAQAHNNLGMAYANQKKPKEAIAGYQRAIEINPDYAEAHNNLGITFEGQENREEAAASYRRAIEINPNHAGAHNNLGNLLRSQEKVDQAVASYRRALEINPRLAEAHNNLGIALKEQDKLDEAVASYQRAIEINPNYAEAHNNFGNALRDQDKEEEALASYQRAIDINPDFTEAHLNRAGLHTFHPGDPDLEKLKGFAEDDVLTEEQKNRLLFALGIVHDKIGLYADAYSYYRQGNDGKAKLVDFNPSLHRNGIKEVKRFFSQRPGSAGGDSGAAEDMAIFVIGMSRSGKTLVESLLSQHEDVYGAEESHAWSDAMKTVVEREGITKRFPRCMKSLTDDQLTGIGEIYMQEISKDSPESRYFVNTMPSNYPYVGMIFQALPSAKIIYCHRHPLDHCLCAYFYRYKDGNGYSYDSKRLASYYVDYHDIMAHWRRLYGDRILSVGYEELVRNPVETGARVYQYCGLDFDPAAVPDTFRTDEIGRWKHYEPYLGTLRQALGGLAEESTTTPRF